MPRNAFIVAINLICKAGDCQRVPSRLGALWFSRIPPRKRLFENPNREVGDVSVQPTREPAADRKSPNREVGDSSF